MSRLWVVGAVYLAACQLPFHALDSGKISCTADADCPREWSCNLATGLCRNARTPDARCGDGQVDPGEVCDCGDDSAALPADCVGHNDDGAPNHCRTNCKRPSCGDGAVDAGEQCDDGNGTQGDGCSASCVVEQCGNAIVDPSELCDDGNVAGGDGCSSDCRSTERCGNGYFDFAAGERCDCGEDASALPAGCLAQNGAPTSICTASCETRYCGDGIVNDNEVCDDGNALVGDGCTPDCLSKEVCGNGYRDTSLGEQCDDGNAVNHDGCSSACLQELPTWSALTLPATPDGGFSVMTYDQSRERLLLLTGATRADTWWLTPGAGPNRWRRFAAEPAPSYRIGHRMAYDAARGRVVLFGGKHDGTLLADTWEFDGVRWSQRVLSSTPSARAYHAMAYDAGRSAVVIYGGLAASGISDDTWLLGPSGWTSLSTAHKPPPLYWSAMAYDANRSRLVLFGGNDGPAANAVTSATWELDASDWVHAPSGPVAVGRASLAAQGNRLVAFGGYQSNGFETGGTWFYNGAWTTGPTGPAARGGHAAALDTRRNVMVVYGGTSNSGGNQFAETWEFDGATWALQTLNAPAAPTGRYRHAAAYDDVRHRLVVFGGDTSTAAVTAETWEFDGVGWQQMTPPTTPDGRRFHAMTFHQSIGKVVMFGGTAASGAKDTCLYDGSDWSCASGVPSPSGRFGHSMTYDPVRNVSLLFGGRLGALGSETSETWEFDGSAWHDRTPSVLPSPSVWPEPRAFAGLGYDPVRQAVVLFGGATASVSALADAWFWDAVAQTWRPLDAGTGLSPSARQYPALLSLPGLSRLVLHGGAPDFGTEPLGDTWALEASQWRPVTLLGGPPTRYMLPSLAADGDASRLLSYGGRADAVAPPLYRSDVWSFQYASASVDEQCTDGVDNDGDTLADCSDPDCSRKPVCTPQCASAVGVQSIAPGISGCPGAVTHSARRSLCAKSARVCTAAEWAATRGTTAPSHHYWVDEALRYAGHASACGASATTGTTGCPSPASASPMLVCTPNGTDVTGGTCGWVGCGLGVVSPAADFGGCLDSGLAGTLCCNL